MLRHVDSGGDRSKFLTIVEFVFDMGNLLLRSKEGRRSEPGRLDIKQRYLNGQDL